MKRSIFVIIIALAILGTASAQKRTLDDMMERLASVNFSMLIGEKNVEKAELGVTTAPFLPSLSASATQQQKITDGTTNTLSVGASLSWRMFDGGGMFHRYAASKESLKAEQLRFLMTMEDLTGGLVSQYNYIISLTSGAGLAEQSVRLSKERYAEALSKYNIGAGSGLEMRLAKTDLNADSSRLIKSREDLEVAYVSLNEMLRYTTSDRGYISDSIIIDRDLDQQGLLQSAEERNTQILLSRTGTKLSDLELKLQRSARYPTLDFGAAYNAGLQNIRPASRFDGAQNGSWGFTIGVNLFNGMETSRKIHTAEIEQKIAKTEQEQIEHEITSQFARKWINYQNNLQLIDFERENATAMALNLQVAMERYRLGELSGLDFRNIQLQFLLAEERRIASLYQAKISEIDLLTLSGLLL